MKAAFVSCLGSLFLSGALCAGDSTPADWPQWRGPDRTGAVPNSPPLLERWPEQGPKLLWQAELPGLATGGRSNSACIGGAGSITVAEGKAVLYAHCQYEKGKVRVSTEMLKEWGWAEGMPEDLSKKLEAARKDPKQPKTEVEREKYVQDFLATLDKTQAEPFAESIRTRLTGGKFSWNLLQNLAKVRDKEFDDVGALAKEAGIGLNPHGEGARIMTPVAATGRRIVDTLLCYDAETGQKLWQAEFPGEAGGHYNYGASSTPAIANGKCYTAGSAGVYCVSLADGKEIWKASCEFTNSSPLVCQGMVMVCQPNGMTAYDAENGKVLWTQPEAVSQYTSASPWVSGDRTCLIAGSDPVPPRHRGFDLICMELKTGKVLWESHTTFHYATPAIAGDIAVTFNKGNVSAHQLSLSEGKMLWRSKETYDERGGSALVYEGCAYMVGGGYKNSGAHCYDLKTGNLNWTQKYGHIEAGSAILADDKVLAYATEQEGKTKSHYLVMFKASPEKYKELAKLREEGLGSPFNTLSSPTVANGRLYLRLDKGIACFEIRK